jgi:hypothetical protein
LADKKKLWSVTTLIGKGVPKDLTGWAAWFTARYVVENFDELAPLVKKDAPGATKVIADARYRRTEGASARGTELHAAAELMALGDKPTVAPEIEPYVAQFQKFLDDHKPEYLLSEAPVYNLTHGYAGTLDGLIRLRGRTFVIDYKTTDKPPSARSRPPYPEVAMQLCAYSRAEFVGLQEAERTTGKDSRFYLFDAEAPHEPMPKVDGALALMVSPYDYKLVPVRIDDSVWEKFLAACVVADWSLETSKQALGPAIRAPKAA